MHYFIQNNVLFPQPSSSSFSSSYISSSSSSSSSPPLSVLLSLPTTTPLISFSKFDQNHTHTNKNKKNTEIDDDYDHDDKDDDSMPSVKPLVFDKKDSLIYLPENLVKIFNYSDWNKLYEFFNKHADQSVVSTIQSWHGMHLIGIDALIKYFITVVHSKPDVIHCIDEVETIGDIITAKTTWFFTDVFNHHEKLNNSNYQNDIILSNLSCARSLRYLPQMNLKDKSSNEVKEILDLIASKEDLLLSGVSYMHLNIDKSTRKMVKFHINHQILKIRAKK